MAAEEGKGEVISLPKDFEKYQAEDFKLLQVVPTYETEEDKKSEQS